MTDRTKKEAVTAALDEYVRRRKQQRILTLFGSIDYRPDYDYKKERNAKRKLNKLHAPRELTGKAI
jgi:Bacterial antitoxin of type II TA system, VapB